MVFLSSVGMLSCRGCPILWMIPCYLYEPPPSRYNFFKNSIDVSLSDSSESVESPPFTPGLVLCMCCGFFRASPSSAVTPRASSGFHLFCAFPVPFFDLPRGWRGWDMAPMSVSWECPRAMSVWATSPPPPPPAPRGLQVLAVRAGLCLNAVPMPLLFRLPPPYGSLGQTVNA